MRDEASVAPVRVGQVVAGVAWLFKEKKAEVPSGRVEVPTCKKQGRPQGLPIPAAGAGGHAAERRDRIRCGSGRGPCCRGHNGGMAELAPHQPALPISQHFWRRTLSYRGSKAGGDCLGPAHYQPARAILLHSETRVQPCRMGAKEQRFLRVLSPPRPSPFSPRRGSAAAGRRGCRPPPRSPRSRSRCPARAARTCCPAGCPP